MNTYFVQQHLARAWSRHWVLQIASVSVMSLVLLILNLMFLGVTAFNQTIGQWGKGLEMTVYLREGAPQSALDQLQARLEGSGEFESIQYISKGDATKKFLTALGPESLELLSDPKWNSPIPASFELKLSEEVPVERRIASLQDWANQFHGQAVVEDVFYGQGWIENFSRFVHGARGVVVLLWILSLSAGLLIVSNCIRLSFLQRREEIEVLELVGATMRFIRFPFLIEGMCIGLLASVISLALSFGLHSLLLGWLSQKWDFWIVLAHLPPLPAWALGANLATGCVFGVLGAWNCVRKLNTGWAAAE
jgi:cell division transport system permease protein